MNRRRFLQSSSLLVGVLAGCSIGGDSDGAPAETAESPTSTLTPTRSEPTLTATATQADSPDSHLEAFERDISREEIEIRTLEVQESVLKLEYTSAKREYEEMSAQIGRISGFFFKQLRGGWDISRLNSEVHIDGGPVFTWHARAEWYESYAAGEITADELSFKVLDTATRKDAE